MLYTYFSRHRIYYIFLYGPYFCNIFFLDEGKSVFGLTDLF